MVFQPSDFDIPNGWATIIGASIPLIGGAFTGLLVSVRRKLKAIEKDAREANSQVSNSHVDEDGNPINLREEQDERHQVIVRQNRQILQKVTKVEQTQIIHGRDIGGIREELRGLHTADQEQVRQQNRDREHVQGQLDEIMHTIPRDQLGRFTKKEEDANE